MVSLPFFRIALQAHLEGLLGMGFKGVSILPYQSQLEVTVYTHRLDQEGARRLHQICDRVFQTYYGDRWTLKVHLEKKTPRITAKQVFINLVQNFQSKKSRGRNDTHFKILGRPLGSIAGLKGYSVRIKGKRALRKYMRTGSQGHVLRGTKLGAQKDVYTGQVQTPMGTTGILVTIVRDLGPNLTPRLRIPSSVLKDLPAQKLRLVRCQG